jgi:3-phosphoshikimate 1-carboxyvinyltransferase
LADNAGMAQTVQTARLLRPLTARRGGALRGVAQVPGDKSVSHRALIVGAITVGETRIAGLLEADDVLRTADAMRALGADVVRDADGAWSVHGVGVGGFNEPKATLDFGNSGTGCRLTMGAVATTPIAMRFDGDESLRRRPMARVLDPLSLFGATYEAHEAALLPLTLKGALSPVPITYEMQVASAQVKSAMLLAALNVPGRTTIIEHTPTRDHTERMLRAFGADITVDGPNIAIMGETELKPTAIAVPGDPSSAAFPLAAALIVSGSDVTIEGVMLNPGRIGLITTLCEMGASIAISNRRTSGGEDIGDIRARHSMLKGAEVPPERAPSMIDEYPILAFAAAFAEGTTTMRGIGELRVKESDRLSAVANGLRACGVTVQETEDTLTIEGRGADGVAGGTTIATNMDHRIAMSFLVMGLPARDPVTIDDASMIATSFPGFESLMRGLGADIV